jgi:putative sigma-54 modulation protein
LRSHVEEHFDRIAHLFDGNGHHAHIIIEVEKGMHRSEIILKWRNEVFTATSRVDDMYQSLTQTIQKIERQAQKLKNKIIDKQHKGKKLGTITPPEDEIEPEPASPRIIQSENYPVKPMTPDEAVLLLNEEKNYFLVFRLAETQNIAVIYKREDGNYGLIQP